MKTNKIQLILYTILTASVVHAGVISAIYTPQTGTVNVDFDTLQIDGLGVSDWMIWDDSSAANIHDRKSGGQIIVNPGAASPSSHTSYTFSWSDGGIVGSGVSEAGLGYKIFGAAVFNINAPAESEGTYRVYTEAGATAQSFYNPFLGAITIPAGTHGYIDVKFENTAASPVTIEAFSTWQNADTSIYAAAVSQIPEPAVASFVILFGTSMLFIKRRLTA